MASISVALSPGASQIQNYLRPPRAHESRTYAIPASKTLKMKINKIPTQKLRTHTPWLVWDVFGDNNSTILLGKKRPLFTLTMIKVSVFVFLIT